MFKTRLISGIVLVAVTLAVICAGGGVLAGVLLAVSLMGMHELYRAVNVEDKGLSPLAVMGYAGAVVYYAVMWFGKGDFELVLLAVFLNVIMGMYVICWPRYRSEQAMAAFFGIVYVAVMLSFIYKTRILEGGAFTVWLIFFCSWGCDTFAYCAGMLFGKHKMAPRLSPKKSMEGAVGGVAGAALLGALFGFAAWKFGAFHEIGHAPAGEFALICALGAVISMFGDLAASAIKRNHDIKDYGRLIPGHGGILDRFDSVIFTAPLIWLLARLLLKS